MFKKIALPFIIIIAAVVIFSALKLTRPETAVREPVEKSWLVEAVTAEFTTIAPDITIYGRVETPRDAMLKASLEADVEQVLVLEGDNVRSGQRLLKLDDTDVLLQRQQRQADIDEILASIDSEKARFKRDTALLDNQQQLVALADKAVVRAQKLEQTRLASKAALDEAKAAYEQQVLSLKQLQFDIDEHPARLAQRRAALSRAQALLEQTEVNQRRTEIKAPFNGRVAKLNVALGGRVRAGDSLVQVYDLDNLEVRAQIPGRYINQVRQMMQNGKSLQAVAQLDGQTIHLELTRLSGEVRQDSGGLDGLFRLINNVEPLPLGTFVELQLQLAKQENVIEIPFSALYGLDHVYLIQEGFLQAVAIERIGEVARPSGQNSVLIRSNEIAAGDMIAITQLPNAITGLKVEIAE
ncbi:Membrane fusion protein of RND family multidrug efflux pump [Methylophaga thiooxydans]|uniref:Membrane fusion protein of RND family multidrug efflux pump n=1 Tax=Methylophaga thiooxydans TaxID=392484 RepID=A0A0A0BE48_9GAMM|nr:HlyD family efflux transporter periplasmic adaptor subunit [Methylophaga thiooxydans]KGM06788.1 Membrane fusion protein of RND family multidrug efflux pump [Methylophaga thiooxydans]